MSLFICSPPAVTAQIAFCAKAAAVTDVIQLDVVQLSILRLAADLRTGGSELLRQGIFGRVDVVIFDHAPLGHLGQRLAISSITVVAPHRFATRIRPLRHVRRYCTASLEPKWLQTTFNQHLTHTWLNSIQWSPQQWSESLTQTCMRNKVECAQGPIWQACAKHVNVPLPALLNPRIARA